MRVVAAFLVNTLFNFGIGLLVAKFLGPDQFGRFALVLAVAAMLQTAFFEWIRLSAVRFYSERARLEQPELRATLDLTFTGMAALIVLVAAAVMLTGLQLSLSNTLVGLAVAAAIANGLFDYNTALIRARFHDRLYSRLILTKNGLALLMTGGAAYFFGTATAALVGVCVSMAGSVLLARDSLVDEGASPRIARRSLAAAHLGYAAPIVVANVLYLSIPLANRAMIAHGYGFAETGQFSLALDIGTRIIAAIGSALDVLLFQMAVRADEMHGRAHGRAQVARNMGTIFAVMMPVCAGIWLTLPSLERLVVPTDYRGPFEHYFSLLIVGLFSFGMINFAVNPVFQIAKRTLPMIAAALVACIVDASLILILPAQADSFAIAQSGGFAAGLVALLVAAGLSGAHWPKVSDLGGALLATAAMVGATLPLRAWQPGVLTLVVTAFVGAAIYAACVMAFDIAGLRGIILDVVRKSRARFAA